MVKSTILLGELCSPFQTSSFLRSRRCSSLTTYRRCPCIFRSQQGLTLYGCSHDGSIVCLDFTESELPSFAEEGALEVRPHL
jgi:hypothetical protein